MAGTVDGGKKTAATNLARYGKDYYVLIGQLGGSAKKTRPSGFAANKQLARIAGRKGGLISRRGKSRRLAV